MLPSHHLLGLNQDGYSIWVFTVDLMLLAQIGNPHGRVTQNTTMDEDDNNQIHC